MTAAAHIVLLLAVARDPASLTIAQLTAKAAATPFVEPPRIELRVVSRPQSTGEIRALARETAAEQVVVMTCSGRGCGRAELRAGEAGEGPSRTIHFEPVDEPSERGRALGLLVSTLLPDGWSRTQPTTDPVDSSKATAEGAAVPAIAAVAPAASGTGAERWGVETEISLLPAGPSDLSDGGITLTLHHRLGGGWSTRAGLRFELGDLPIAGGTAKAVGAVLGVSWMSPRLAQPHRFGFGVHADLLALARFERFISSDDSSDEVESRQMLALGADVIAMVGFSIAERTTVFAGAGGEYLPDVTTLGGGDANEFQQAAPHPLRLVFQVGVLSRF